MACTPFARLAAKRLLPTLARPTSARPLRFNASQFQRSLGTTGVRAAAAEYQKTSLTEDVKEALGYEYGFASTMKPKELTSGFSPM